MLKDTTIGFIGGGQMAEAIIAGLVKSGAPVAKKLMVTDVNEERLQYLKETYGAAVAVNDAGGSGIAALAKACEVLVLAVKPHLLQAVLKNASGLVPAGTLVVSIAGGVTLGTLATCLPGLPLVRVMPNIAMQVCRGAAGIVPGPGASEEQVALCRELFDLVGITYVVPEALIDPLTSVSGCGPAFAYMFIEAMADGGVAQGLPRDMAMRLAAQTLAGAAETALQTGKHPGQLKDSVCSPGGSTIAGVQALERNAFRGAVMEAVADSKKRMEAVGRENK